MLTSMLPYACACFNLLSAILLVVGWRHIHHGRRQAHESTMFAALVSSALFLGFYVANWVSGPPALYPYHDWTRPLYLWVLLTPHIILAALMGPFIIALVVLAKKERFAQHKALAHWVWPVWMYVSVTGVLVFLLLRVQPLLRPPPALVP